jgi:hypothetical protein
VNQAIAFSKTLRALEADDFRASKLGLAAAALVIGAWVWWLVAARVPQYESTTQVRIENGHVVAYFPSTAGIAIGQPALLYLSGKTISTRVQSVAADHVDLSVPSGPQPLTPVSIEIETSRVSPATLALRMLGEHAR